MNPLRHIAGIPEKDTQRCVRCCEIIARKGTSSTGPAWPGSSVVAIGDRLFSAHVAAKVDYCAAVDLDPGPYFEEQASVEVSV